jgi:hypothetical protein
MMCWDWIILDWIGPVLLAHLQYLSSDLHLAKLLFGRSVSIIVIHDLCA